MGQEMVPALNIVQWFQQWTSETEGFHKWTRWTKQRKCGTAVAEWKQENWQKETNLWTKTQKLHKYKTLMAKTF